MIRGVAFGGILVVLLSAATVSAQEPPETPPLATFSIALSATPSNERIVPITGTSITSVNVTVTCEQGSLYAGTSPAGTPASIRYMANSTYPAAVVVVSKSTTNLEFTPEGCLQGMELTDTFDVAVSLGEDALFDDTVPIEVTATLDDGTTESITWDQTVGVYFRHQVQIGQAVHTGSPGTSLEVAGTVSNLGNAAVRFVFDELPDDARQLRLALPDPLVVPPFTEDETFMITVDIPSSDTSVDRRDQVVIQVQARLDSDPNVAGEPEHVDFVVQTKGGAGESPGPAVPFLVVFAAALWTARRRGRSTT